MDFRKEAEKRAFEIENTKEDPPIRSSRLYLKSKKTVKYKDLTNSDNNETPKHAKLAEIDYKWNGQRARVSIGDFVPPRWVPDEEITHCKNCNSEFDWVNRKHHCRHCGNIFCINCANKELLLPEELGYRDPARVCLSCSEKLGPMQKYLSTSIANHQRINNIDIASPNCNVRRYFNMPYSLTLGSEIRKAAYSTHNLFSMEWIRDKAIPLGLLSEAKGLAYLTVGKGGFLFAPRIGTGLVISKLPHSLGGGWSAPSAIGTFGLSWGALVGLDITDYVVILNTYEAVQAFSGNGQLAIGAGIEVAVGPIGRSGSADMRISSSGIAPAYSYSHSRGLFAGVSLDGSVIFARNDVNHKFYGRPVSPSEILFGEVPPPRAAEPLYSALTDALSSMPNVQHNKHKVTTIQMAEFQNPETSSYEGEVDDPRHRLASYGSMHLSSPINETTFNRKSLQMQNEMEYITPNGAIF